MCQHFWTFRIDTKHVRTVEMGLSTNEVVVLVICSVGVFIGIVIAILIALRHALAHRARCRQQMNFLNQDQPAPLPRAVTSWFFVVGDRAGGYQLEALTFPSPSAVRIA